MRGEDPDDPAIQSADFLETIERTAAMLERILEEEGIETDSVPLARPTPLIARRLREAGMIFVERAHAMKSHAIGRDVDALWSCSILLTMKLARLACLREMDEPPEADLAPNRLLLERVDEDVRAVLGRLSRMLPAELVMACEMARAEILELLAHAFGPVPDEVRAELQGRVAEGRAPSPFCVRPVL
jgi:hypothetical protein